VSSNAAMPQCGDRLQEIRARLDAATPEWDYDNDQSSADVDLINHAPADIAWLLAEVEQLRTENGTQLLADDSVVQSVTNLQRGAS
jgi:hypothetical protein